MGPLPPLERRPEDEDESREKLTWPWEKAPEDKETKKKPGDKAKKEPTKSKQPKEEQKEKPKKEEKQEKQPNPEEEKRERRTTLLEQSLALVAKYEEEPIPRDTTTLARLMIAHQVIHLNNQLEQPDNEHPLAPEEIESTLDYITKLDAKFKDPDTKAEPDVEQSYQEIMELAEATLEEEPDLKKVVADMDGQTPNNSETASGEPLDPVSAGKYLQPEGGDGERSANKTVGQTSDTNPTQEEFNRRKHATKETVPAVATASALIYLITHLGRKKPKKETEPITPNSNHGSDYSSSSPDQSPSANPQHYLQPSHTPSEQLPSPINQSLYPTPFRSEHTIPSRERVTIPDRRPSPALATAAVATAFTATRSRGETSRPTAASPETHHSPGESAKPEFTALSQKQATTLEKPSAESQSKIEHMPLLQLLSMAENVDIGHGRYLRREFESGRIDKEGLVKILKSYSKGRDYRFEFHQQASRFAKLKEMSPEFLHQAPPAKSDTVVDEPPENTQTAPSEKQPEATKKDTLRTSQPLSLAPPTKHDLLPELANSAHQPEHIGRRLILITIATLGGLALIGLLAIAILNALS